MATRLKWATIIGGLAAIGYFFENFAPLCEQISCFKWGLVLVPMVVVVVVVSRVRRKIFGKQKGIYLVGVQTSFLLWQYHSSLAMPS
ncbi:MAG: hypothetical protein DRR08_02460 [Candidatus Parabeggiatoa sp. nov. 2]|nr:MAG: hypothetical protein B6247_30495 [Beggiatoa sp. 4572_84]RKZ63800.1 MAG: hypothetical protein DRR08_02460 [Gammaproteobacteria bacterium]